MLTSWRNLVEEWGDFVILHNCPGTSIVLEDKQKKTKITRICKSYYELNHCSTIIPEFEEIMVLPNH